MAGSVKSLQIIGSMTVKERKKPDLIKASRKVRIAAGSGTSVQDVNKVLKQYKSMRKMMKGKQGKLFRKAMQGGMGGGLPGGGDDLFGGGGGGGLPPGFPGGQLPKF